MSKHEVVCENVTCNNKGSEEDFDNNLGVPLCDDCYSNICNLVADELSVARKNLDLWTKSESCTDWWSKEKEEAVPEEVVCENVTCSNKGKEEDFDNNIGLPLCDDCYTVTCNLIADQLGVDRQQLDL